MFSILVVESDQKLSTLYCSFLEQQGYATASAERVGKAIDAFERDHFDVVLCDTAITGTAGGMIIDAIRLIDEDVPLIALSANGDFRSKQRAFVAGADDFMVKPIDLNELLLRIEALLRRAHIISKQRIVIGNAVLDNTTLTVVDGADSVVLPPKEFKVLFKLCASPGRIFTRRDIMDDVWGIHVKSNERTVDVHVKRLRERFSDSKSFAIETVRGIGYKATECPNRA